MSTTLTNGLKLPDKGSVDWYADMQNNYQILDGSVGTIAAHTSALAGKAPLVHTHTKADITDFPALANVATSGSYTDLSNIPASFTPASHTHGNLTNDGKVGTTANLPLITGTDGVIQAGSFGNAANTFCEGNDSRLSDARTPVAHTHTKSDVTDLLNSNFIPSANNSYDLGSSSYQWNNLYAKNYYYNGTEFQNKFVTLDTDQTLLGRKNFKTSYSDILPKTATLPSSTRYYVAQRDYAYNDESLTLTWGFVQTSGMNVRRWYVYPYSSGDSVYFQININADASSSEIKTNVKSVIPVTNNTTDLGSSTNKWKSLNGINPGALSFPKSNTSVTAINTSGFSFDGSNENVPDTVNLFSNGEALVDGWLCARLKEGVGHYIFLNSDGNTNKLGIMTSCFSSGVVSTIAYGINVYVPVKAGDKPIIRWAKPDGGGAQLLFYPCFGNV